MRAKFIFWKRTLQAVLLVLLLSVVGLTNAQAQSFTVGSLNYSVNDDGTSVTLTGHVDGQSATGTLTIPESVTYEETSYAVTKIDAYAFQNCSGFTGDLVIPNSVTEIGERTFYYCTGFDGSLTIGENVTNIGHYAFAECSGITTLNYNAINSNASNAYMDYGWIEFCHALHTLNIGENVQVIPDHAFNAFNVSFTGGLVIPSSVTSIGYEAFRGNEFTSITSLAETPPSLGDDAFADMDQNIVVFVPCGSGMYYSVAWSDFNGIIELCPGEVTVAANPLEGGTVTGGGTFEGGQSCTVTAIANEGYMFSRWTENGVRVSGDAEYAFYVSGDRDLVAHFIQQTDDIIVFADAAVRDICVSNWDTNNDGVLSYMEAAIVTDLGTVFQNNSSITTFDELQYFVGLSSIEYAFEYCTGLTSIVFPESLTTIGDYAFHGCIGFTGDFVIPNTVITIGERAFYECTGLDGELTIGENVTNIGHYAFASCSNITTLNYNAINSNASNDWYGWIEYCYSLHTLNIGENVQVIPNYAFKAFNVNFTGELVLPSSVVYIGDYAFEYNGFTGELIIPSSVMVIGQGAFEGCSGFSGQLVLPTTIDHVAGYTFKNCTGFEGELTIPTNVNSIGEGAFENCNGLTGDLVIPNTVTTLGNWAFRDCTGFTGELVLPNTLTSIGENTFLNCSGLTGVLNIPSSVTSIGPSAFQFCSGFTGTLDIPAFVTSIGAYAFNYCTGFTGTLVISENVTEMGEQVFGYCSGITEVHYNATNCSDPTWSPFRYCGGTLVIGNNVERIPHVMFNDAYFTGSLVIPNSVTSIGSCAFWNCNGFTGTLTIPNSVTEIGEDAFNNCSGFTGALVIPNSLTEISNSVFAGCSGFTSLVIPNTVTKINWSAFNNCTGLAGQLIIPNSVTEIGNWAFENCSGFTGNLILPDSLTYIGESAFKNCSGFTGDLIIPNAVTTMNYSAFENCSGFNGSLVLNNTMDYISGYVFKNCSGFTGNLVIPASVTGIGSGAFENTGFDGNLVFLNPETQIGYYAFKGCSGFIGELALPTSLNDLGYEAFRDCSGFTSLTMSLTWISDHAFDGCTGLTQIRSNSAEPPYLNWGVFDNVDKTIPVYVPCGSQQAYQAASGWSEFTNYEGSPGELYVDVNSAILGTATVLQYGICEALESTVHAEPYPGCVFVNWTVNGEEVSTDADYTFDHTNGDITLVANFELGEGNFIFIGGGETEFWSDADNWMPTGLPTATSIVCIRGNVDINEDVCVAGVYLYDDNVLIVRSGTVLTVAGTLSSPSASSIIIEDGAQVFHSNEGAMATVQKTVAPYTENENDGWYIIASPMAFNVYIHDVPNLLNGNYDLYYYDEPTHYWMNMRSGLFEMSFIDRGRGYLYANNQQVTFSFLGEIENGTAEINIPLSYTENIQLSGFNLVGNPFMHNVVSYASENVIEGCFRMNDNRDDFMVGEISEACPLQPTEGFFVKAIAEDASITFNPGRGTTADRKGSLRVEVLNDGKLIDRLIVKSNGQPLEKLSLKENNTKLFATLDGQEMAIVPVNGNEQAVNFKAAENGTYMLTVNTDNMDVDYLHLIDNLTGNEVDLLATSTGSVASYTFEAKTTDYASRFRLVFSMGGDADDDTEEPFAFFNGSEWVINSTGTATLQVVDMMGRVLVSTDVARNLSTSGMAPGVYVLRLVNGENVKTQKIVVR